MDRSATLVTGGPYQRIDDDSSPVGVEFQFPRFNEIDTELYASDHCPVFLEIP